MDTFRTSGPLLIRDIPTGAAIVYRPTTSTVAVPPTPVRIVSPECKIEEPTPTSAEVEIVAPAPPSEPDR